MKKKELLKLLDIKLDDNLDYNLSHNDNKKMKRGEVIDIWITEDEIYEK